MSARKVEIVGSLQQHVTVEARQSRLSLSSDSIIISKHGIEFRSTTPFSPWTEMIMTLQSPRGDGRVHCNGVVISCTGCRHAQVRFENDRQETTFVHAHNKEAEFFPLLIDAAEVGFVDEICNRLVGQISPRGQRRDRGQVELPPVALVRDKKTAFVDYQR